MGEKITWVIGRGEGGCITNDFIDKHNEGVPGTGTGTSTGTGTGDTMAVDKEEQNVENTLKSRAPAHQHGEESKDTLQPQVSAGREPRAHNMPQQRKRKQPPVSAGAVAQRTRSKRVA
eukprot:TRINITY_DN12389_c0_g1_i2.p1 TRINITY_DN12389_c0_g1~~TRINITY_DN12389_c0_g1_i2.p1  ORF type:complete len:118 (+),score=24.13 TRINITY_DN12389_c0_g1_i2:101-454(+)